MKKFYCKNSSGNLWYFDGKIGSCYATKNSIKILEKKGCISTTVKEANVILKDSHFEINE